jgi:hypothetical protein
MPTEPRVIRLVAAPDDADKSVLTFRGKHCRDLCFPYANDDGLPATMYRLMPHPDNPKFLSLRGAADYGIPVAYTEGLSLPNAPVSQAVMIPDKDSPDILRAQAYSECYYCIHCFQDNDIAKPRKDLPTAYAAPRATLNVSVTSLFTHTPAALENCPPPSTSVLLGLNSTPGCDHADCTALPTISDGLPCDGPKDAMGTCDDLYITDNHVVSNWAGCQCIVCACQYDTIWHGWLAGSVVAHCIRVDNGNECSYRHILEICFSRLVSGSPASLCSYDGFSVYPCFQGSGTWWACFEVDPGLMCAPTGTYVLYRPHPETGEPVCGIEVEIS